MISKNIYDRLDIGQFGSVMSEIKGKLQSRYWTFERQNDFDNLVEEKDLTRNQKDILKFYTRGLRSFNPSVITKKIRSNDPRLIPVRFESLEPDGSEQVDPNSNVFTGHPIVYFKGKRYLLDDILINSDMNADAILSQLNIPIVNKLIFGERENLSLWEIMLGNDCSNPQLLKERQKELLDRGIKILDSHGGYKEL